MSDGHQKSGFDPGPDEFKPTQTSLLEIRSLRRASIVKRQQERDNGGAKWNGETDSGDASTTRSGGVPR